MAENDVWLTFAIELEGAQVIDNIVTALNVYGDVSTVSVSIDSVYGEVGA